MVKRSLARKAGLVPRKSDSLSRNGGINKDALPMHRGRKKRVEARKRLERKKDFIAAEIEKLHRGTEKKRAEIRKRNAKRGPLGPALAILDDMAEALPSVEADDETEDRVVGVETGRKIVRHKERRRIVATETEQVNNVREHPVFKQDPIEALRQHLVNTVSAEANEIPAALGAGDAGAGKKKKNVKRKGDIDVNRKREGKRAKGGGLGISTEESERIREEAKERVAAKREQKAVYAEAAMKLKRRKEGGKIEKQSLKAVVSKTRGRIGVKRAKI